MPLPTWTRHPYNETEVANSLVLELAFDIIGSDAGRLLSYAPSHWKSWTEGLTLHKDSDLLLAGARHSSRPWASRSMDIRIECSAVYTLRCLYMAESRHQNVLVDLPAQGRELWRGLTSCRPAARLGLGRAQLTNKSLCEFVAFQSETPWRWLRVVTSSASGPGKFKY